MDELLARLRALFGRSQYLLTVGGLAALTVAAAAWVAIPARKQAALLSAEAARLQAVIASSNSWVMQFQPATSEEAVLWQNSTFEIQALGVRPSERVTLAQVIARRADEAGLGSAHIRFLPADAAAQPPPRQVAGITFNPAPYRIQVTGAGSFGTVGSLIGALPPAVDLRSVNLARESSDRVTSSLTLSVFEPAGANGK